tara:strand:- start:14 stop:1333 length:1320 start_codon:yes stop_codon:yes gene_type:complete
VNKKNPANYIFENDRVNFKSYLSEFSSELFEEFDLRAKKIGLDSKIEDLFNGEKVNYTEGLAALHPRCREKYVPDEFNSSLGDEKERELWNIFFDTKNIVVIGIGGSLEGPKMLIEFLASSDPVKNFFFITGSDDAEFSSKTAGLNPDDTIFFVSSKSFTTEETLANLRDAISWSGDIERFVAITANASEAKKYNIKNIIEIDQEIGGRYSIWSDISIVPKWYSPEDFDAFMEGGKQADIDLKTDESYKKFVKRLAYSDIWHHNFKNKNTRAVLSYIWNFRSFPNYIQQLEMESLGKQPSLDSEFKKTGQIIFGGYGPTAQHSYFQLLHQGTQDVCVDIVMGSPDRRAKEHQTLAHAQAITQSKLFSSELESALKEEENINGNIPTNLFEIDSGDLYALGYLIATWEHRTYITAMMLGINPFDQFGVIAGKQAVKKFLD